MPVKDHTKKFETNFRSEDLCLSCGLCCNGSIFSVIPLDNTLKRQLPLHYLADKKHQLLQLPCTHYVENKCGIYNTPEKPHACSQFRCRLLFQLEDGKSSVKESLDTIKEAKAQIEEIQTLLRNLDNYDENTSLELNVNAFQKQQPLGLDSRLQLALVLLRHRVLKLYFRKYFGVFEKKLQGSSVLRNILLDLNLRFFRSLIFVVNKSA